MQYIMALDQGTTSSRCILFDKDTNICSQAQKEFEQIYPKPGWVEHNPTKLWETICDVMKEAMENIHVTADEICAIGITNQRETTVVWDKETGEPIYNAIVWQCRRTAKKIDELKEKGLDSYIKETTGLVLDAYFSGTKIQWILDEVEGARERAQRGEILFGTVDTWLMWKLSKGKIHATDYTNASRTMLYNIKKLDWDERLLKEFHIPLEMLPVVKPSSGIYGYTDATITGKPIPIAGVAGDQQAALFGQCCFQEGDIKNTYGTGCFLLMNTGKKAVNSKHGLITTIAASTGEIQYALEGSVFVAGAAIQWLRDGLKVIESTSQSQQLAAEVEDTQGAYVVPAFTGLGAPYWDPYARGIVVGITRGFNEKHLIRATLESLAYQVCDVIEVMEQESAIKLESLRVDGGASANDFLMQFQADMLHANVLRPKCIETTALGVAYLAGLAVSYWHSKEEIKENWALSKVFVGDMEQKKRQMLTKGWKKAIRCAQEWSKIE